MPRTNGNKPILIVVPIIIPSLVFNAPWFCFRSSAARAFAKRRKSTLAALGIISFEFNVEQLNAYCPTKTAASQKFASPQSLNRSLMLVFERV